jgi:hypothetical protein
MPAHASRIAWLVGFVASSSPLALAAADARLALSNRANELLAAPIVTVMDKQLTPPSDDKHDYYAPAPYHWPNPNTPDGLPYVMRDGQVNPDANSAKYDRVAYFRMGDVIATLSVAYELSDDNQFAQRAAEWLRAWFTSESTRMNPNLEFAQCVPGRSTGLPIGLIRGMTLLDVARSARLLSGSTAWSATDQAALDRWLAEFRGWLDDSQLGHEESRATNNHGTWFDAQRAVLSLYLGDRQRARQVVQSARDGRLARQIAPDGRQPMEMLRTKSWDYSVMNLEAWIVLADVGREVNVDLWGFATQDHRSIARALDYLEPFASGRQPWPRKDLKDFEPRALVPLLRRAAIARHNHRYAEAADALADDAPTLVRSRLLAVPLGLGP